MPIGDVKGREKWKKKKWKRRKETNSKRNEDLEKEKKWQCSNPWKHEPTQELIPTQLHSSYTLLISTSSTTSTAPTADLFIYPTKKLKQNP